MQFYIEWNAQNDNLLSISRKLLSTSIVNGLTGKVEFSELGERMHNNYKIINVQQTGLQEIGRYEDGQVKINDTVIWPGETSEIPKGTYLSKHLRVRNVYYYWLTIIKSYFLIILLYHVLGVGIFQPTEWWGFEWLWFFSCVNFYQI